MNQSEKFPVFFGKDAILWRLGFRPFFLLAAIYGALIIPLWLLMLQGKFSLTIPMGMLHWHSHEMVFGFGMAVVGGFLLTAVKVWTKQWTAHGALLGVLALLWLLGRLSVYFSASMPSFVIVLLDACFPLGLLVAIARAIFVSRNQRNYIFVALLCLLLLSNLGFHLSVLGMIAFSPSTFMLMALNALFAMIVIIGGRILPMFTRNALGQSVHSSPLLGKASIALIICCIFNEILADYPVVYGSVFLATGVVNLLRMKGWRTPQTLMNPILFVLHFGYLWIGFGFLMRGLAPFTETIPPTAGLHAATVGAMGMLITAMMTRVALGHTGRQMRASKMTVLLYASFIACALTRILSSFVAPLAMELLILSGALWSLTFVLYLVEFGPILLGPRVDGKYT